VRRQTYDYLPGHTATDRITNKELLEKTEAVIAGPHTKMKMELAWTSVKKK